MSSGVRDLVLSQFPSRTFDKIRRIDGGHLHVSNVAFPAFCETGRDDILERPEFVALTQGFAMYVVRFAIDYRSELFWPGEVEIGTGIKAIGSSSITFSQGLFQNGRCAAIAEAVQVQVGLSVKRPVPLSDEAKTWLSSFLLSSSCSKVPPA